MAIRERAPELVRPKTPELIEGQSLDPSTSSGARGPLDPRLVRRASAVRQQLLASTAIGLGTAVIIVATAWFIAYGVGSAFDQRSVTPILAITPWLAGAFVVRGVLSWMGDLVAVRTSAAVKSQLRREVAEAYLRPDHDQPDRGTVITLMTTGLDDLDGYFAHYLPQLVLAVAVPAVICVAVGVKDLLSAVIIVITLPLIPVFMALVGWATEKITAHRWQVQARLAHHFVDLVAGLPTLRAFGRANGQAEGLRRSGEANRRETMATLRIALLSALVLELLATLSVAIVAVVIGLRVIAGHVDLTTSLFVLVLAPEAYLPLRKVGVHYHDAATGAAAARAALDLIDQHARRDVEPTGQLPQGPLEISVCNLGYAFPTQAEPLLQQVSFLAPVGGISVLWGPSGSGKSTLLRMITGWTKPSAGRILINGCDCARIDPAAVQAAVAWVGQEPSLISGTVADNVRLGLPTASAAQIAEALAAAGVDLEPTRVVHEGTGLSAGELRRVALARAWLRVRHGTGRLMLLDEPTAGLDAQTELDAIRTIKELGVTAIVVSHRPAVLASADRVVRLGAGS